MSQQPRSQGFPKGTIQLRNLINFDWQITIIDWPMWWDLIHSLPYTIQYFTLHVHFIIISLIFHYPTLIWRQHNDVQTHFQVDLNRNACTRKTQLKEIFLIQAGKLHIIIFLLYKVPEPDNWMTALCSNILLGIIPL